MELIRVEQRPIAGAMIQTFNARDLHAFLEVQKDFLDWIKVQIKRARLVDGRDFVRETAVSHLKGENPSGGRPRTDYHLTMDAGKHIGMLSGTEKGFEIREYFLKCEQQAIAAQGQLHGMMSSMQAVAYEAGKQGARDAITEMLPSLVEKGILQQHGAYIEGWTAGDVVGEVLEDRTGTKGLSQMVSRRLTTFHIEKSVAVRLGMLGANKARIFDPVICNEWLKKGGRAVIERYALMCRGQGKLALVVASKKKPA